ncbi:hypothetical protein C8N46_11350 [Kordia periserrulae]|uniref:Uncharacterized protein n=1 Tax=Kordia periserrulae TaxID=701523 RepID=A0A2T6BR79_9FLAO|nr:hypothetical protein [Kordia periserrulae]PTX58559.1 hypothetical protein C8N46_11350 [Kordia periserrulae]
METATVKQNGSAKKETTTAKTAVTKKLAQEAVKPAKETPQKQNPDSAKQPVNLLERIQRLEKLKGISAKRERLVETLLSLSRFNYNSSDSCSFYLKDASGMEFKTTNSNLITLVATQLQTTLENKKEELEKQLMEFEL